MKRPVLGARWLIQCGPGETQTAWRIDGDALGRTVLHPCADGAQLVGDAIVTLDIETHPWRRRLQHPPANATVARALIVSAVDEFPFPPEKVRYAIGFNGNEVWLCAIENEKLADLALMSGARPQAILLAPAGIEGAQAALRSYRRYGASVDFLGRSQWLIHRHWLKIAARGLGAIAAAVLVLALMVSDRWPSWLLARQVADLEIEVVETVRRYQTVQRMQAATRTIAELHASPEARVPEILERAFATIPAGHVLSRIEYRNGTLILGGTGPQGHDWLRSLGIPEAAIHTESVGSYHHFRAEFNPEQIRLPTTGQAATQPAKEQAR
jgi:hypothetical protein